MWGTKQDGGDLYCTCFNQTYQDCESMWVYVSLCVYIFWLCGRSTAVRTTRPSSDNRGALDCCLCAIWVAKDTQSAALSSNTYHNKANNQTLQWGRRELSLSPPCPESKNDVSEGGKKPKLFHLTSGEIITHCSRYIPLWLEKSQFSMPGQGCRGVTSLTLQRLLSGVFLLMPAPLCPQH